MYGPYVATQLPTMEATKNFFVVLLDTPHDLGPYMPYTPYFLCHTSYMKHTIITLYHYTLNIHLLYIKYTL